MKTLARIGTGLSFLFFLLAGVVLLAATEFRVSGEYLLVTALGLFFVGKAFFAGTTLWLAVEKRSSEANDRSASPPGMNWEAFVRRFVQRSPRFLLYAAIGLVVLFFTIVAIARLRMSLENQSREEVKSATTAEGVK